MAERPSQRRKEPLDPPVLIPYSQLVELLEAPGKVLALEKEMKRIREQLVAVRYLYSELLEKVKEIQ